MRLDGNIGLLITFLSYYFILNIATALPVSNLTCSGSQLLDFRIAGCKEQPCKIRKGEPLPFEVDLSFERPKDAADDIYFNVYLPKYAKPPAAHGSSLFTGTCGNGNLGFSCPANPDAPYTLKSSLYIEPEAVCTAKCENIGVNGTGLRETKWRWTFSSSKQAQKSKRKGSTKRGRRQYSLCHFSLTLDIVE